MSIKRLLLLFAVTLLFSQEASAIPRFSLLTGTRCSACHYNPQGSGIRTELGYQMMNQTGLFQWKRPDSSGIPESGSNTFLTNNLTIGADARAQLVTSSRTGERLFIPMQLSAEAAYTFSKQLNISTDINLASIAERARGGSLYAGEADFDAALQYQPSITWPTLRVGMIQPSIGIRQDDHTTFARQEAGLQGTSLIPPYYNEVGAELVYEGMKWLTVNAGLYNSYNLSQVDPSIGTVKNNFDFSHPSVAARVMLWPQLLDQGINGEVGASVLSNGDLIMINPFIGFGLADKSTLFLEALYAKNANDRIIRNFSIISTYQLVDWLSADLRFDWGQTELYPGKDLGFAQALTVGFEWFVLPYIELRPEYRVFQRTPLEGRSTFTGQYTGQLHIFY